MSATAPGVKREAPAAVLGAGSWGTALAIQLARSGRPTHLWGRDPQRQEAMASRSQQRAVPRGCSLPRLSGRGARPRRGTARRQRRPDRGAEPLFPHFAGRNPPASVAADAPCLGNEGIRAGNRTPAAPGGAEVLGSSRAVAVLSGPTFAREVGHGLPTAMTIASPDAAFAQARLRTGLSSANFRAYTSTDIIGVEVGGAVKNVLAVGAGLSDGSGFGANTRVALITRGLVEMTRLGVALGAHRDTFMGLAGLGDLVLTCTDDQSRNRRFGLLLAAGRSPEQALADDRPGRRGLQRRPKRRTRRSARARGNASVPKACIACCTKRVPGARTRCGN